MFFFIPPNFLDSFFENKWIIFLTKKLPLHWRGLGEALNPLVRRIALREGTHLGGTLFVGLYPSAPRKPSAHRCRRTCVPSVRRHRGHGCEPPSCRRMIPPSRRHSSSVRWTLLSIVNFLSGLMKNTMPYLKKRKGFTLWHGIFRWLLMNISVLMKSCKNWKNKGNSMHPYIHSVVNLWKTEKK